MVGMVVFVVLIVGSLFGPLIYDVDPEAIDILVSSQPPSAEHPFGTDDLGRDLEVALVGHRLPLTSRGITHFEQALSESIATAKGARGADSYQVGTAARLF